MLSVSHPIFTISENVNVIEICDPMASRVPEMPSGHVLMNDLPHSLVVIPPNKGVTLKMGTYTFFL